MPNLIFELGCEEMPASAVQNACDDLLNLVQNGLSEAGLSFGLGEVLGTPRRILLHIPQIADRQSDREDEIRGPRVQAAFDSAGQPTKALQGFCRGHGVDPGTAYTSGDYVWIKKQIAGRSALEVLAELLPEAVKGLKFEKTMRWGLGKNRFVRPVRWILALLGQTVIPFNLFDVTSGSTSRGHRFMAPAEFTPTNWDNFLAQLRSHSVEPDPSIRRKTILDQAIAVADGIPDLPEALVDENVQLTEWPTAHQGSFAEEFLELPDPVLVTAMAKHERFFPVRDSSGAITNRFVSIRNNGDEDAVKAGNEWVLNARFNDARFFYNEDKKRTLDQFLVATESMLFQDRLGTVRQRADRLAKLTPIVDAALGGSNTESARLAGLYAKADLSSGLVGELSSLQGVIGGEYARREGFGDQVANAIADHYRLPSTISDENRLGAALLIADQLDKLTGFLGLKLIPKGSSDPFGLRRAASLIIQTAWLNEQPIDVAALVEASRTGYAEQSIEIDQEAIENSLLDIFASRYQALMPETDYDIHESATSRQPWTVIINAQDYQHRTRILAVDKTMPERIFSFTRPINILASARGKSEPIADQINPSLLSDLGVQLKNAIGTDRLSTAIHNYFESTMVMDENPEVRANNLALLQLVEQELLTIGDYSKLVIEG
jgi:glycyl-tRNA synthetase beta chain